MKIVYIAHPLRGDVENNIKAVKALMKTIWDNYYTSVYPIAPWLHSVEVLSLDDSDPEQRKKGMQASLEMFKRKSFDELWVCGSHVSEGMAQEIEWASDWGIPIRFCCFNVNATFNIPSGVKE